MHANIVMFLLAILVPGRYSHKRVEESKKKRGKNITEVAHMRGNNLIF